MAKAPLRPVAFMLASTNHGCMILNRNDSHVVKPETGAAYGVGHQLMTNSAFDPQEVNLALLLLDLLRLLRGGGVFAVDGGANLGVHTLEWARHMHGWGEVLAFEAQERIYYALAGNIALNNCFNARARLNALGGSCAALNIPVPDYHAKGSFGSLELRQKARNEFIGQKVSYEQDKMAQVQMVTIDSLQLPRLDFFKLDIEGMEIEALEGAADTVARCRPVMLIEQIKTDGVALKKLLGSWGYQTYALGMNTLAVPANDALMRHVQLQDSVLNIKMKP
jgi:FkbM family methyltransferase